MNLLFNSYSILLLVGGLFTLLLALLLLKRIGGTSRWSGLNTLCTAWWAITYSCELSSQTLPAMHRWVNLEYLGIAPLTLTWTVFIILFTGKDKWLTKRNIALLCIIPVLTLFIVWTNPLHYLHYQRLSVDHSGTFPMLHIKYGPWYQVFTTYFYLNLALGLYFLVSTFKKHDRIFRKQKNIVLVASLIPWAANLLYLLGFTPINHLDVTPYAFTISSLIVSFGLLRFKLFDIVPVARGKIVEAMRDGVLVVDILGRVIDVNSQMKSILSSKKIIGSKLRHLIPNEKILHKLIQKRENGKIELQQKVNNNIRYFEVDVNPMYEKGDIYTGIIILFRDITERKVAEEKLNEQSKELINLNQLKDRLFSIIAHDLRGPMMNLKLLVNMTDTGMISDEEFKGFLPELSKRVNYTSSLLENLLHWSKSQLEGQRTQPVVFDLKDIAGKEIIYFTQKAIEKGIKMYDTIAPGTYAFADVNMIELVVRNILSNAIKFSSNGDEISIAVEANHKNEFAVCIKDTGSGITPELLSKLFLPETFTTRGTNNEPGTGLGLQLCKEFVEKNNGKIWAESEEGIGSRLYFTIPQKTHQLQVEPLEVVKGSERFS
jgi:PAS domain S-box-containing protein